MVRALIAPALGVLVALAGPVAAQQPALSKEVLETLVRFQEATLTQLEELKTQTDQLQARADQSDPDRRQLAALAEAQGRTAAQIEALGRTLQGLQETRSVSTEQVRDGVDQIAKLRQQVADLEKKVVALSSDPVFTTAAKPPAPRLTTAVQLQNVPVPPGQPRQTAVALSAQVGGVPVPLANRSMQLSYALEENGPRTTLGWYNTDAHGRVVVQLNAPCHGAQPVYVYCEYRGDGLCQGWSAPRRVGVIH